MLTLNKYLREIGYSEKEFPFLKENKNYFPDDDGFVPAEFYCLDKTIAMEIYSKLCYFRDNIADRITPGIFLVGDPTGIYEKGHKKWLKTLDKIIYGYKLYAATDEYVIKLLKIQSNILEIEDYLFIKKEFEKSNKLLIKIFGQLGW